MTLTDTRTLEEMARGTIVINPFDRRHLGSNSYDVHLGKVVAVDTGKILDARPQNTVDHFEVPPEGLVVFPQRPR